MRKFAFASLISGIVGLAAFTSAPLNPAAAHEGHQMECTETGINAMKADIQSMDDGEAKDTATKEMEAAEQTMANKDLSLREPYA
jgi:hypothetical protein